MAAPLFTLVTACMNREEHLQRSLPCWLKLPQVEEIVVVDWSNQRPLLDLCALDSRIRVVRVEEEPRWILSYAYNLGVAHASGTNILKCDADCVPSSEIVGYLPGNSHFSAGNWRSGAPAKKPSVNGQCIFAKAQFEAVNGYSEFIRTYGRDDEDFYDRLIAAGFARQEIPVTHLDFIDHSHADRVVNQFGASPATSVADAIERESLYNEMRNLIIARQLPWNRSRRSASYTTRQSGARWVVVTRDKTAELVVPPEIQQAARLYSLRYIVSTIAKVPPAAANRLDESTCLTIIGPRLKTARPAS